MVKIMKYIQFPPPHGDLSLKYGSLTYLLILRQL